MSSITNAELRQRLKAILNADRSENLLKIMDAEDTGCLVVTASKLYEYFFPNKPLPPHFEQDFMELFPDLQSVNIFRAGEKLGELNLGYEADFQLPLNELHQMIKLDGVEKYQSFAVPLRLPDIPFTLINRERILTPSAIVLRKRSKDGNRFHIMPWTGQEYKHPLPERMPVGGETELQTYLRRGFVPLLLIHFKKSE